MMPDFLHEISLEIYCVKLKVWFPIGQRYLINLIPQILDVHVFFIVIISVLRVVFVVLGHFKYIYL